MCYFIIHVINDRISAVYCLKNVLDVHVCCSEKFDLNVFMGYVKSDITKIPNTNVNSNNRVFYKMVKSKTETQLTNEKQLSYS